MKKSAIEECHLAADHLLLVYTRAQYLPVVIAQRCIKVGRIQLQCRHHCTNTPLPPALQLPRHSVKLDLQGAAIVTF